MLVEWIIELARSEELRKSGVTCRGLVDAKDDIGGPKEGVVTQGDFTLSHDPSRTSCK
jgi:hypothetical protein